MERKSCNDSLEPHWEVSSRGWTLLLQGTPRVLEPVKTMIKVAGGLLSGSDEAGERNPTLRDDPENRAP